jgi:transposase InsO family protein
MKIVAEVIGVSRSNLVERLQERPKKRIGRPPLPDDELVAEIKAVIAELPTYGYRRVHAILKRQALANGCKPPNHKRIYRVMKVRSLLLDRHAGGVERRHDGRIAVSERNRRWCSDGFEIGCDNGERVRVAFALDCCDREVSRPKRRNRIGALKHVACDEKSGALFRQRGRATLAANDDDALARRRSLAKARVGLQAFEQRGLGGVSAS